MAQGGSSEESGDARKARYFCGGEEWVRSGSEYGRAESIGWESRAACRPDSASSSCRTEAKSGNREAAGNSEFKLSRVEIEESNLKALGKS
jgi:hypothetical protein